MVKICPEFADYQIKECEKEKKHAEDHMKYQQGLIAKKLAELKKEEAELPIARDSKIKENDDIIATIKEAIDDNINSSL